MDVTTQEATPKTNLNANVPTEQGEVILRDGTKAMPAEDKAEIQKGKEAAEKILTDVLSKRNDNFTPVEEEPDGVVVDVEVKPGETEKKKEAKPGELTDEDFANMDPKVAERFKKMYGKIKNQERQEKETQDWARKVDRKNETLEKELNVLKREQMQVVLSTEKAQIDELTRQAIAAQQQGDYVKGADLLREVAKREAAFEQKNKEVQPVQEGPRLLSPKQSVWLSGLATRRGGVWARTHAQFGQAAAEVDAMFYDPKYAAWNIKQIVRFVENKYTPGKIETDTTDPDAPETKDGKPTQKKFAQAVLSQTPGVQARPISQQVTVNLSDQQKQVARKLFSGIPVTEAYKRYARGMQ